jgi:uncharacterized Zn finger protein
VSTPNSIELTTLAELQQLVARIVLKCPALASRAEAAAGIIAACKIAQDGPSTFTVRGSGDSAYTVDSLDESCTCPDFQHRAPEYNGARWCKHHLAALMLRAFARPACVGRRRRITRLADFRPTTHRKPARRPAA